MEIKSVFTWYDLDTSTNELKDVQCKHIYNSLYGSYDTRQDAILGMIQFVSDAGKWNCRGINFHLVETFSVVLD